MVGLAHVDRAVGDLEASGLLERIAQRAAKLPRSGLRGLQRLGNRIADFETRVPGIRTERRHAARALRGFVHFYVFLRTFLCGVIVRKLAGDDDGTRWNIGAVDVLASDAEEIVVGDAVIEI